MVLVSGAGTNLQALLDAAEDPGYGASVVAVGADRDGVEGPERARRRGVPTFVHRVKDFPGRSDWDRALTASCDQRLRCCPGRLVALSANNAAEDFVPDADVLSGNLCPRKAGVIAAVRAAHPSAPQLRQLRLNVDVIDVHLAPPF